MGDILDRPTSNCFFEITYGHRRVKDLDDATMLQIMAQENMDEWAQSPLVGMEINKLRIDRIRGK